MNNISDKDSLYLQSTMFNELNTYYGLKQSNYYWGQKSKYGYKGTWNHQYGPGHNS